MTVTPLIQYSALTSSTTLALYYRTLYYVELYYYYSHCYHYSFKVFGILGSLVFFYELPW